MYNLYAYQQKHVLQRPITTQQGEMQQLCKEELLFLIQIWIVDSMPMDLANSLEMNPVEPVLVIATLVWCVSKIWYKRMMQTTSNPFVSQRSNVHQNPPKQITLLLKEMNCLCKAKGSSHSLIACVSLQSLDSALMKIVRTIQSIVIRTSLV